MHMLNPVISSKGGSDVSCSLLNVLLGHVCPVAKQNHEEPERDSRPTAEAKKPGFKDGVDKTACNYRQQNRPH